MLQKLDTPHLNRIALAEALASMEPGDFDMRRRDRCICGHALRLFGTRLPYFRGWESQLGAVQTCSVFPPTKRGSYSRQQIVQGTPPPTPIHRMRREWCAISRPPIPSIGASLASFSPRWSEAVPVLIAMGSGLMPGRLKAAAD